MRFHKVLHSMPRFVARMIAREDGDDDHCSHSRDERARLCASASAVDGGEPRRASKRVSANASASARLAFVALALVLACAFAIGIGTIERANKWKSRDERSVRGENRGEARANGSPRVYAYDVVAAYAHDPRAFTQGLAYCGDDVLCESTGAVRGMSSAVRAVDVSTGAKKKGWVELARPTFAEGLTIVGRDVYVITWKSGQGFKYEIRGDETFAAKGTFRTPLADGWGLAAHELRDGTTVLYVTDASDKLHVLEVPNGDGATAKLIRSVTITDDGEPVRFANELEVIDGALFANILERPCLARIDPETGKITGWVNMRTLKATAPNNNAGEVLNGIAYDAAKERLFVTGKMWPTLFEIKLREVDDTEYDKALIEARATCTPPKSFPNYGYP